MMRRLATVIVLFALSFYFPSTSEAGRFAERSPAANTPQLLPSVTHRTGTATSASSLRFANTSTPDAHKELPEQGLSAGFVNTAAQATQVEIRNPTHWEDAPELIIERALHNPSTLILSQQAYNQYVRTEGAAPPLSLSVNGQVVQVRLDTVRTRFEGLARVSRYHIQLRLKELFDQSARIKSVTDNGVWGEEYLRNVKDPRYGEFLSKTAPFFRGLRLPNISEINRIRKPLDSRTLGHSDRVAQMFGIIVKILGGSLDQFIEETEAALLHDAGKYEEIDQLANNGRKLSAPEMLKLQMHTSLGVDVIRRSDLPAALKQTSIIRAGGHHLLSKGYSAIRLVDTMTAILNMVDIFDSLQDRKRDYQPKEEQGLSIEQAAGKTKVDLVAFPTDLHHLLEIWEEIISFMSQTTTPASLQVH